MIPILTDVRWYLNEFWLAFRWLLLMLNTFSYTCWSPGCLLWKNVYSVLLLIFKIRLWYFCYWVVWVHYVFWILTSSDTICRYFLPFYRLPFSFWWQFPFLCRSLLVWCSSICLFLLLLPLLLVLNPKNSSPGPRWRRLPPMFSAKTFMFSGLPLKSNIFWVVFVCGVR